MTEDLEKRLGYSFQNKTLLEHALTHSSYANENRRTSLSSNERLEFLGDSILGFVVAEFLFQTFHQWPEGELTRMRADLVCERSLAKAARGLELGRFLKLGHGEEQNGGRERESILADAVEAILAAAYLDGGFSAPAGIIRRLLLRDVQGEKTQNVDFKTALQELVQRERDQLIQYHLLAETGPDHDKIFSVEVTVNGTAVGTGSGSSKKRAEQAAAKAAIVRLFPEEAH